MNNQQIIRTIEKQFLFIETYGYHFESEQVINPSNPAEIWFEIIAENESINQNIRISVYPPTDCTISVNIINDSKPKAIDVAEYLDHKTDVPTHYVPMYELDENKFEESLSIYAKRIQKLLDGELNKVITGNEWIDVRSYDLRDDY